MNKILGRFAAAVKAFMDPEILLYYDKSHMLDREAFHPFVRTMRNEIVTVTRSCERDDILINRIIRAYHLAQDQSEDNGSFWSGHYGGRKQHLHDVLMSGDVEMVATALSDPYSNNLLFGFEGLGFPALPNHLQDEKLSRYIYDNMLRLTMAVGGMRLDYAETALESLNPIVDPKCLLQILNDRFGFIIKFPNPFARERGISSPTGVVSHRAMQALFQSKAINDYLPANGNVLEIGAGLGRTAYYCSQFGVDDYTIIDLPLTNVAQAYFLGNVLGSDRISLYGEPEADFKILPPQAFFNKDRPYSVALNADSLTEMSRDTAMNYVDELSRRAGVFISINHEINEFTVQEVLNTKSGWKIDRSPYWLRQGYVQEVASFVASTCNGRPSVSDALSRGSVPPRPDTA